MDITSNGFLVTLSIGLPPIRKYDKKASREVAHNHGANEHVARVNKLLLPFFTELENVNKKTMQIRLGLYERTLQYIHDGTRVLPVKGYLDFTAWFGKERSEWMMLRDAAIAGYDRARASAVNALGSLADPKDYPPSSEWARRFSISVMVSPIPDEKSFFRAFVEDTAQELAAEWTKNLQSASQVAMQDVWRRVYETLEKVHERLASPDKIFRDSLIENAQALCDMLPRLNLTDDPNLESMRKELAQKICSINPDVLRNAPDVRQATADNAKDMMQRMMAHYTPED